MLSSLFHLKFKSHLLSKRTVARFIFFKILNASESNKVGTNGFIIIIWILHKIIMY